MNIVDDSFRLEKAYFIDFLKINNPTIKNISDDWVTITYETSNWVTGETLFYLYPVTGKTIGTCIGKYYRRQLSSFNNTIKTGNKYIPLKNIPGLNTLSKGPIASSDIREKLAKKIGLINEKIDFSIIDIEENNVMRIDFSLIDDLKDTGSLLYQDSGTLYISIENESSQLDLRTTNPHLSGFKDVKA